MSNVFITGGSRGIGYQLVKQYASVKGNTVITTTRNIEMSVELTKLAKELGNIKVLTVEASSQESIEALEKALPDAIPNGIDIFIANAGILHSLFPVLKTARKTYQEHYETNVLGTIFVTKIVYPYLLKKQTRKIIFVSSIGGQITELYGEFPVAAYGQSKAALNYTAKALSFELAGEGFIVIPIHPGTVLTDMLQAGTELLDEQTQESIRNVTITPEVSGEEIIKVVTGLTKEDTGKFFSYDGTTLTY